LISSFIPKKNKFIFIDKFNKTPLFVPPKLISGGDLEGCLCFNQILGITMSSLRIWISILFFNSITLTAQSPRITHKDIFEPIQAKNGMVVSAETYATQAGIKILKKGGKFYFSVPIGKQRIEFNAHRVFDVAYLLRLFNNKFKIDYFSYVDDEGGLFENVEIDNSKVKNNYNCNYGCGIFEMTKI